MRTLAHQFDRLVVHQGRSVSPYGCAVTTSIGCAIGTPHRRLQQKLKREDGSLILQAHAVERSELRLCTAEICDSSIYCATTCPRVQLPKGPAAAPNL